MLKEVAVAKGLFVGVTVGNHQGKWGTGVLTQMPADGGRARGRELGTHVSRNLESGADILSIAPSLLLSC